MAAAPSRHLAYLDCVRGYAILLVMTAHAANLVPGLPETVQRLAALGSFGVQLFFITSMVTLLLSWDREVQATGRPPDLRAFAIRRLFRIAPTYYAGILLYLIERPPPAFDPMALLATLAFANSWGIGWTSAPDAWQVMPGSWSVSVTIAFYVLLPVYATLVRSLTAAAVALGLSVVAGAVSNHYAMAALAGTYPSAAVKGFVFHWLPTQAAVFALGGVVYHLLPLMPKSYAVTANAHRLGFAAAALFVATAYVPPGGFVGGGTTIANARLAALALAVFVLAMSMEPRWLQNPIAKLMGKVSFSAYVLHFAVLDAIRHLAGSLDANATGAKAVAAFAVTLGVGVGATACVSLVTWILIERPMAGIGRRLAESLARPNGTRRATKTQSPRGTKAVSRPTRPAAGR